LTTTYSINNIDHVAKQLLTHLKYKTIIFNAPIGLGKTTLIKAIVKALGSKDKVTSPTFSIVNQYQIKTAPIYHFDLYRIKNEDELFDLGIEEYINTKNWLLIEWPEKITPLLQYNYASVSITQLHNGDRHIILTNH